MDMTSVSAVLSSIKTAADIAKLIKDSDISLEKAETKLKLAELISSLADAKIQLTEIQQLLVEKDAEIRAARELLVTKGNVHWEPPYYWLVEDAKKEGPFCQHCWDKNRELIRLQGNGEGYWECKACKNGYRDKTWESSSPKSARRDDPYRGY